MARHFAKALGHHIGSVAQIWARRLEAERQSEAWQRENRDLVEVPGLTTRSEDILKRFDALPQAEKPRFLAELSGTPEGQQVLEETKTIAHALQQRFGSSDPRDFKKELDRLGRDDRAHQGRRSSRRPGTESGAQPKVRADTRIEEGVGTRHVRPHP